MSKANAKYIVSTILIKTLSEEDTESALKKTKYPKFAEFYKLFMDSKMSLDDFHEKAVDHVIACNSKLGKSLL